MDWDRDGSTAIFYQTTSSITTLSASQREDLNNEAFGTVFTWHEYYDGERYLTVIFPEQRDIAGLLFGVNWTYTSSGSGSMSGHVYTSADTTNGIDGTWTDRGRGDSIDTGVDVDNPTKEKLRNDVAVVNWTGVKAIRLHIQNSSVYSSDVYVQNLHIFGTPSSGEAADRLEFYDPATDTEVGEAYFDWGDVPRSSTYTRDFRIHNPSATLTANSVEVTMEALTDTSPSNVGQHDFSTDGGSSWASTASLGDLAPGATSGVITLRRTTSGSADLGLWWTRMIVSAASWT